jgi:O-antigen biosynthesis protein
MDLSVIIVNYNVRFFLEQCLHSVRRASANTDCEVFVVDNNSADGSCSMVSGQFPEVKLIRNLKNIGFSAANNQAIRLAKGEFILLLNPDTIVEEETFNRCIAFMNEHTEAGALGVSMINGNGKFMPESKRALPTPGTAFFKMSGLAVLFPKSKIINRYYLGHLDRSVISEAEIISGAFMFIRKKVLEKTGLLDESFFMYGEDIDLSYRILKAGFKNYYYPEVKIIHYKGESTRKGDINYIVIFYKAMLIFIRKHFSEKTHKWYFFLISTAVYFWGLMAVMKNVFKKIFLPFTDALLTIGSLSLIINFWEKYKYGGSYHYPEYFHLITIAVFTLVTVLSVFLTGGYKVSSRLINSLKGTWLASSIILILYSILPLELRFSRAVIILGIFSVVLIIPAIRYLISLTGSDLIKNPFIKAKRSVIVGDEEGLKNVRNILDHSKGNSVIIGRVSLRKDDLGQDVLGTLQQFKEVVRINRINEIIFSTRELSSSKIINIMHLLDSSNVTFKIAPPGENILIGSKSVYFNKDFFSVEGSFIQNDTQVNTLGSETNGFQTRQ